MILDIILPSGFMMQGFLMALAAAYLIIKFRDKEDGYRGK